MENANYYLKSSVMLEPLVDGWYAWAHLIPPATAARNLTERHLRIMDSYIDSPETHAAAVKNPSLLGGPFMDFDRNRAADVKKLRDRTLNERGVLDRSFALRIRAGCAVAGEGGVGYSLESLYAEVELIFKYVELGLRPKRSSVVSA